jgi:peptide/nickel transport system substrate-binding protein
LFREVKKNKWWFFSDPTIGGTGTYKVTKIKKEGDKIVELELTSLEERLVYRFYPTEDLAFLAFKRGEVDALERMTSQDSLSDWKRLKITPALQEDQYIGVFFNTNNQLFDKPIRQALNYALPKVEGNERALTPIDPRSWAYNKTVKEYAQDQAKAISLLLRAVPQQRLSFELSTVPNFQHDAEQIRSLWEELGTAAVKACQTSREVSDKSSCANLQIAVQLKIVNVPDVSNFQVLLIAQQAPQDPDQYYLWHSTQQTNFTGYRNPHVDKLLEDGRKSIDQKERKSLYQAFQELLIDDSPAIFLRHTTWYTIER